MAAVPTTGAPPQVTLSMQQGMQLMTMRQTPTQGNVMQPQQVRSLTPRMILSPQVVQNAVRTSQPGVIPGAQAGQHLLVKTQNGEMHLVRVNSSGQATPVSTVGNSTGQLAVTSSHVSLNQQMVNSNNAIMSGTGTTTILPHSQQYRFQSQVSSSTSSVPTSSLGSVINSSTSSNLSNSTNTNHSTISNNNSILNSTLLNSSSSLSPTSSILINQLQQGSVQQAANQAQSTAGQIISAESAKNKCKNFLSTLLKLAADQKQMVAISVRSLIQGLIDGHVEPETFTEELQKDLNSSPQPCLVPFLKKTLPYLRLSLAKGEITIEGVNAPPMNSVSGAAPGATTVIPNSSLRAPVQQQQLRPPNKAVNAVVASTLSGNRVTNSIVVQSNSPHIQIPMANGGSPSISNTSIQSLQSPMVLRSSNPPINNKVTNAKDRPKDKANFASYNSFSSSNVADDDINDVAAMGGVNLGEESQRILDSTGFVGTQIRSVKDETFLMSTNVQQRLKLICGKYDLEEPSKEFSALLSHAVQERLKTALEKLSIAAEHRLDIVKNEPKYEVVQDVKSQLKFIEDLDRLEKKRKDEVEREILLRAAKSRNKNEDPDQAKLKAKAKEMQRVEMEEMRQRDANMAALKALQGPRKRAKLDINSQEEIPVRQRTKRVNLRDLTFMMEQEKELNKSSILYKAYLK